MAFNGSRSYRHQQTLVTDPDMGLSSSPGLDDTMSDITWVTVLDTPSSMTSVMAAAQPWDTNIDTGCGLDLECSCGL